jgi:hypothetical protein
MEKEIQKSVDKVKNNSTYLSSDNDNAPGEFIDIPKDIVEKVKKLLDLNGASDAELFQAIGKGLKAENIIIDKYGDEHRNEDHSTRHKYILLIAELKGYIKRSSSVEVNNSFTFAQMVEVASKAKPVEVINDRP